MIQLLFTLIFAEMALIVLFVFKTPLRKLVIMALDRVKRGRGPIVVKTVAGTMFVVMIATVYNAVVIQRRWIEEAEVNPTDQILFAKHLLEASLMGFSLFLALMIDRLHHYIRELRIRRKSAEGLKKQNRVFEDGKPPVSEEVRVLEQETSTLRGRIKELEAQLEEKTIEASIAEVNAQALKKQSEGFLLEYKQLKTQLEEKTKEANNAEACARALEKQSEGLLLEYDRLLEENQDLRSQLQSLDRKLSFSESKKVM
ncbi:B-cell receptor-associated protein [Handroanthus impetiginosus]|uniref:Endoplasmic reticulum transmembrane protein n=1 Tax=Handroanthus impetiginosus TaxID=429701 RepID=A0A2G9H5G7_9LAMI|nr:B-cell receptor-associated protein [Handroanthus impetiginosus]